MTWKVVVVSPLLWPIYAPHGVFAMPSLFRFLALIGILCGLLYGGMFALANLYQPKQREMTITVPPDKFAKQR